MSISLNRRAVLAGSLAAAAPGLAARAQTVTEARMLTRPIASTGEALPLVGIGTWQTFDIDIADRGAMEERRAVLQTLFDAGGRMIDSSPMYGRAEAVVGALLGEMKARKAAFLATKVWTSGAAAGLAQMDTSMSRMAAGPVLDLMQIHNLVDWRTHMKAVRQRKEKGVFRYIGVTHYTTSAFDEVMGVMRAEKIDFVQIPYSLAVRAAEAKLIPLARERGIAVIPNRPFDGANMFDRVKGKPLPAWAAEIGAASFGQIFLKYLIGETAVGCVIPGTAKVSHMRDNIAAATGPLPEPAMRETIRRWWDGL